MYSGIWGDLEGVIKCQMEEVPRYDLGAEMEPRKEMVAFNKPTKGTSVEKFKEMILSHLKVRVHPSFLIPHQLLSLTVDFSAVQVNI